MKSCTMTIKLLSDLCVSDGGTYNSMVDTDICHDKYGFPYIPAKRIRGVLRECAIELKEWGYTTKTGDPISISELFGDKGDKASAITIGDAMLEKYDKMCETATKYAGNSIMSAQNILSSYSYLRTQTAVNYDTGIVDDSSLRTIRVANKGLVFCSEVVFKNESKELYEQLKACCTIMRHMGIARTRGLGDVEVTLSPLEDYSISQDRDETSVPLEDGSTRLDYEITLLQPIVCKSVNGGEAKTLDYIEGSKMLGLISNEMNQKDFRTFLKQDAVRFSNAYVSVGGRRYTEVPGYIYRIKDNDKTYINKLYENDAKRKETENYQLNQMKHCYVSLGNEELYKEDVETEERYHHRRPEDKSIGRALNDEDFYHMDSISEGQTFAGTVTGNAEQIRKVYDTLSQNAISHIGYGKTSEYGKVKISIKNTYNDEINNKSVKGKNIIVDLVSPTIVYAASTSNNDMTGSSASPSTNVEDLKEEILYGLELEGFKDACQISHKYLSYTYVGGYNVTWGKRKPTILTFDKGTSMVLSFNEEVSINTNKYLAIGERTREGYGEVNVSVLSDSDGAYMGKVMGGSKPSQDQEEPNAQAQEKPDAQDPFIYKLCVPLFQSFVRNEALNLSSEDEWEQLKKQKNTKEERKQLKKQKNTDLYRPCVSVLLLLSKENDTLDQIEMDVEERFAKRGEGKQEKLEAAKDIIDSTRKAAKKLEGTFCEKQEVNNFHYDKDEKEMLFLREFLTQLKYLMKDTYDGGRQKSR